MVIEDLDLRGPSKQNATKRVDQSIGTKVDLPLAAPFDRIGAALLDVFVVLSPLLILVASPFRRQLVASIMAENESEFIGALISIFLISLATVLTYLTVCTWRFGATLGMMFMKIKVVTIWSGSPPDLGHSFLRSLVWFCNFLFLGLPNLSIFSNRYRRSVQDRVSDTIVITKGHDGVGRPSLIEISLVQGAFAAVLAFVVTFISGQIFLLKYEIKQESFASKMLFEKGPQCELVSKALKDWPSTGGEAPQRLQVAMALFAADSLDEDCLNKEADFAFKKLDHSPLSYLAKAFVNSNHPDLSNDYLEMTCRDYPKSDSCLMSKIVENWSNENWPEVERDFNKIGAKGQVYVLVWGARQFIQNNNFEAADRFLSQLSPNQSLSNFVANYKAKALWGIKKKTESRVAASVSYSNLPPIQRMNLAGWMCHQEFVNGCSGSNSESCKVLFETLTTHELALEEEEVTLSVVRAQECQGGEKYLGLEENVSGPFLKTFFMIRERAKEKNRLDRVSLWQESKDEFRPGSPLWYEVRRRIINLSESQAELSGVLVDWQKNPGGLEWENLGYYLFSKYMKVDFHEGAYIVGKVLLDRKWDGDLIKEGVVLSAFNLGLKKKAWTIYNNQYLPKAKAQQRGLASTNGFKKAVRLLHRKFGKR